jgi:hypothetical protein
MTTIEDVHGWLNIFDPDESYLGPTTKKMVAAMCSAVKTNDFSLAWSLADRLPKLCDGFGVALEAAEARLECACCILEMGNTRASIKFFQDAASRYHSSPHHRGVSLWLLGHALWKMGGYENEAILAWRKSIKIFGSIQQESRFISSEKQEWYQARQHEMRKTLKAEMMKRGITSEFVPPKRKHEQRTRKQAALSQTFLKKADSFKTKTGLSRNLPKGFLSSYPLIGNIPAGTPVGIYPGPDDEIEIHHLTINNNFYQVYDLRGIGGRITISEESNYYTLVVHGHSMDLAGIDDGDYVLLKMTSFAQHNEIVAAIIQGHDQRATLKRFIVRGDKIFLRPDSTNPKYKEFPFGHLEDGYQIHGVARAVLKPKKSI